MRKPLLAVLLLLGGCQRGSGTVTLATTTSVQDTGLFERLQPVAEKRTGAKIRMIAVGSGQALLMAERGDADVVIAHSPEAEEKAVAAGHLVERKPLMWNRFVIAGPPEDPARVREATDPADAFRRIRESSAVFVSRGDESGTHKKEQALWKSAGLPAKHERVRATGQGIGETLILADELGAYTLADSSSFSRVRVRRLVILHESASLANPYSVSLVNPEKHPAVNAKGARAFRDWLVGPEAAAIIGSGGLFSLGLPG